MGWLALHNVQREGLAGGPSGALIRVYRYCLRKSGGQKWSANALIVAITVWVLTFSYLVWLRQSRYGSFGFDTGIYDQATWLISRSLIPGFVAPGHHGLFITVRGLPLWGQHANAGLYLLAPFYWVGAGPQFLNIIQVISEAVAAVPVFLLARDRLGSEALALALAGTFLLHPSLQWFAWEEFHPEVMAIAPLLFAYYFSVRGRWVPFALCAVLALAWKEDVALVVAVMGLIIAARGHRKVGLATVVIALTWFVLVIEVILPAGNGSEVFYASFFPDLGSSPPQIVAHAVLHPTVVYRHMVAPGARSYMWQMVAPFGFIALAAAPVLGMGIPQTLVNLLSINSFTRVITDHYAALPLAALILATVEGVRLLGRRAGVRSFLAGFVLATSLAATIAWGVSPIGANYRKGYWPLSPSPSLAAKRAAVALVPPRAAVSASYDLDAHLAHRYQIYEFPNPWVLSNWGVDNKHGPSPNVVQWLAIDVPNLNPDDSATFEKIMASGTFRVVFRHAGVVVARRVHVSTLGVKLLSLQREDLVLMAAHASSQVPAFRSEWVYPPMCLRRGGGQGGTPDIAWSKIWV